MSFTQFGLPPTLVQALSARSLDVPLPVQEAALPLLMAGKSAMLVSRTGSGKTLAYLLPILAGINPESMQLQAVVLAPTHELAMQIHRVATELARDADLACASSHSSAELRSAARSRGSRRSPIW